MPRGGKREGAGRKKGSPAKIASARAMVAAHFASMPTEIRPDIAAMTPLQVMLRAMTLAANEDNWKLASSYASAAAPYVHARLSNVEMNATVRRSAADYSEAELLALAGAAGEDGGEDGVGAPTGRPH